MYRVRKENNVARLADDLPWAIFAAPGLVLNKDGSLQRTLRFRGPDLESSTKPSLVAAMARLNNALKRFGTRWSLHVEARRVRADSYPDLVTADPISQAIDLERRRRFLDLGDHFRSDYYMTFSYLPAEDRADKAGRAFIENAPKTQRRAFAETMEMFDNNVRSLTGLLESFMPEIAWLDDSETLTYLHDCVSFNHIKVAAPESPQFIDSFLYDTDFLPGLAPRLGDQWLKILSIHNFPGSSVPGMLDRLNALPFEYRWTSRFLFLDKLDAQRELDRIKTKWFAKRKSITRMVWEAITKEETVMTNADALNKAGDTDEAIVELAEDLCAFGYFTPLVMVWDSDPDAANDKLLAVKQVIDGLGFVSKLETYNSRQAWLSSLPGHVRSNDRRALVSTLNLAHMIPASAIWAGEAWNNHLKAPALLVAQTSGSTPLNLNLHTGDVGHTMIVGPTGSGKSTLLSVLASQWRRYNGAQVYVFDKGRSMRAMTLGTGGTFYDLGNPDSLAFQPLENVDSAEEQTWALEWIIDILRREGLQIEPELKGELWSGLQNLGERPKAQRTLTLFRSLVQDAKVKRALEAYTIKGAYGAILDASETTLGYSDWQCFEMEELMHTAGAVVPTLLYLFHSLEKRFSEGRPTILILDEAWLFLDNSLFAGQIREWLKVLRKKNVSVIFATQSLADVENSSIASALIDACPQRIFLPNDRAQEAAIRGFYERFGLNRRQLEIIAHAIPKSDYYFQCTRGNRLFSLHLGPVALAFAGASDPAEQALMDQIYDPAQPDAFARDWLKAHGLSDEIPELEKWRPPYVQAAE